MPDPIFHSFPEMAKGALPAHYATDKVIFETLAQAGLNPGYDHRNTPCFIPTREHMSVARIHVAPADILLGTGGHSAAIFLREHLPQRGVNHLLVLFLHDGIGPGQRGAEAQETTRALLGFSKEELCHVINPDSTPESCEMLRDAVRALIGKPDTE